MKDEAVRFLGGLFGGAGLGREKLEELAALCEVRSYGRGEVFVRAGDQDDRMAIVIGGLFRAYYLTDDGKLYIRKFYRERDVMGSFATALAEEPAHVSIDALADSRVVQLRYA